MPSSGGDQSAGQGGGKATDSCPAVIARTSADISADFSLPITVAQTGVFHACRNNGCLQLQLSGSSEFFAGSAASEPPNMGGATVVVHNYPSREPYVVLTWSLQPDPTSDYTRTDLYTLNVEHDGTSTELIRASTTYVQTFYSTAFTYNLPDPTICGSWGEAVIDLRPGAGQLNGGAGAQAHHGRHAGCGREQCGREQCGRGQCGREQCGRGRRGPLTASVSSQEQTPELSHRLRQPGRSSAAEGGKLLADRSRPRASV